MQALKSHGLELPRQIIVSGGLALRYTLLATGRFVTCIPHSLMPYVRPVLGLKVLPIRLTPWHTASMIMTLHGREPTPAAELFLAMLR